MKLFLSTLLFCSIAIFGNSQTSKSQTILNTLSSSMKKMSTFYVEFNANIKNAATGVNESEKGMGWVKGNMFFAS